MPTPSDAFGRLLQAISAIVRETFPNLDFLGVYLYEVFSWSDSSQTAELKPVGNSKMPIVSGVGPRLPGLQVKLNPGDQVLVGFQDGDPAQPFIAQLMTGAANAGALPIATQGSMVSTSVSLAPALSSVGVPIPGTWTIMLPFNPALPPWSPAINVIPATMIPCNAKLFGVTASGSLRVKTL
jgi:hypothetical protein